MQKCCTWTKDYGKFLFFEKWCGCVNVKIEYFLKMLRTLSAIKKTQTVQTQNLSSKYRKILLKKKFAKTWLRENKFVTDCHFSI